MAGRNPSRALSVVTVALMLLLATSIFAQQLSTKPPVDEQTAQIVAQMVPKYHLNRVRIDDKASEQLFDRFIDQLDPQKILLPAVRYRRPQQVSRDARRCG